MSDLTIDPAAFRQVMGCYPTGVCAVTALDDGGEPVGMVVGTFTSVSIEPPLVGFLPSRTSSTWPVIEKAGRFCVNVLGSGQQELCRQIAMGKGTDKFEGVEWATSDHGLPVIAGALAIIECSIHSVTDAGDHLFVLGAILRLEAGDEMDPMLFHRGRYGGFAEIP